MRALFVFLIACTPARPASVGTVQHSRPEDTQILADLNTSGQVAEAEHVVIRYPNGALTRDAAAALVREMNKGVATLKRLVDKPQWSYRGDRRVYFYLPDAQLIAHASCGNTVFIPLWRMRDGKAPWLHEAAHVLLPASETCWRVVDGARVTMPQWFIEGLAESIAMDASAELALPHFSPLYQGDPDAVCKRALASEKGQEALAFVGEVGVMPELFSGARGEYAPAFYSCATSFTRQLVSRIGRNAVVAAMGQFQSETAELERVGKAPLAEAKAVWLGALAGGAGK